MDLDDGRIVEAREVISGLRPDENLAAMDWKDFEHLIRELFEKEFAQNGVEVKVTRAETAEWTRLPSIPIRCEVANS
jgi:restriction system protein